MQKGTVSLSLLDAECLSVTGSVGTVQWKMVQGVQAYQRGIKWNTLLLSAWGF